MAVMLRCDQSPGWLQTDTEINEVSVVDTVFHTLEFNKLQWSNQSEREFRDRLQKEKKSRMMSDASIILFFSCGGKKFQGKVWNVLEHPMIIHLGGISGISD